MNYQGEDGIDPRIVQDLDPRVGALARKLLEPLISKETTFEGLARAVELYDHTAEEDMKARNYQITHEVSTGNELDSLDVEGAKRIMRQVLRGMQSTKAREEKEEEEHELSREHMEEQESASHEAFDVNAFRMWNDEVNVMLLLYYHYSHYY